MSRPYMTELRRFRMAEMFNKLLNYFKNRWKFYRIYLMLVVILLILAIIILYFTRQY